MSLRALAYLSSALVAGLSLPAAAAPADSVEHVLVEGDRVVSSGATGLDLSLRQTPQSVTVVDRSQIDDFALNNVNDLLDHVTGVSVDRTETDRTQYTARGFDITSFQVDGIGLPLMWNLQYGDLDTAIFERVEVVRGADSMMTGVGNPSATINYVRKRPTDTFQALASASYGSWDDRRIMGDVSSPLNESGTLRARFVAANEDRDSYLNHNHVNRNVLYGVVSWEVLPGLTATGGYSWQDNRSRGVLWGALPLEYADGSRIDYSASASTSADWTFWNVRDQSAFGELAYDLGGGWQLKGVGTYRRLDEVAKLLYAYGNPDKTTGLGVAGLSGVYPSRYNQYLADFYASGPFTLFGRQHQLALGANYSQQYGKEYEDFSSAIIAYPPLQDWGSQQPAEPTYPGAYLSADQWDRLYRFYAATHLNITDNLKGVAGLNYLALKSKGFSYGVDTPRDESAVSPYLGLVADFNQNISVYVSYTDIFNPQSEVDSNHQTLPAAKGTSIEGGIKSVWLDGKLYATAAVFKGEQNGLADYAGSFPDGKSYYAGIDTIVRGYELEASGRLTDQWWVTGGWTDLSIHDPLGQDVRLYAPRQTLKLSTTYTIPDLNNLKLGGALRWQSATSTVDLNTVTQASYTVLDLMAGIDIVGNLGATLNVRNITDEKYFNSLRWNQAFMGAPRSVTFSLDYKL